ncbi:MAG: hypothetical protein H7320_18735 [Ferruginibacter sp.]|nr:hypothetical protein [Ferruginibacter sp.]
MLKYLLSFLLLVHGLIHFMGFAKAYNYGNITQLTKHISKPGGMLWFITALLFIAAMLLFLLKNNGWPVIAVTAVIISQILIFNSWNDAKFGSIANVIILIVAIAGYANQRFETHFRNDVKANLHRTNGLQTDLLTEQDIHSLPFPVQKYLRYCGAVNKPKVNNMKLIFNGEMRDKGKDWFKFRSVQYNFFDEPTRLFFMKAKMKGFTVPGYHKYSKATALMDIRLFGFFPVLKKAVKEMNQAETVTLLNEMCLMAPATLIDKRITWQATDSNSAKATFTNHGISITAILYFNAQRQLIDFISNDRDINHYLFSTPVSNYKNINGINIMTYGETTWHHPDGKFDYGKFNCKEIEDNVSVLK